MNESIGSLRDKVIVITGAAQGIGAATAQLCAARGGRVIMADVKVEFGEALALAIRQEGGDALFHQVDIRQPEAVQSLFNRVQTSYGRLDVLIAAAGVMQGQFQTPEELTLETFEFVMDVNVKGTFLCAKYATPLLEASKGTLILIASGAGVSGGSSSIAYGTSKGAVNGMGMVLEGQLARRGIRVNVVCPGSLNTDMKRSVIRAQAEREGSDYEEIIDRSNLGDPIGVARLLAFLVSDEGDYVRQRMWTR